VDWIFRLCLALAVIGYPAVMWHSLGKIEFLESLGPEIGRWLGVKFFIGSNGKRYLEPLNPVRRLQLSLLMGLATASVLGTLYWAAFRFL
jgi:hypothetical protein